MLPFTMAGLNPRLSAIRFGVFEADLRTCELRKWGVLVKLQEKPFRILSLLLASPGEMVTREEIQRELWPDNTYVDFENGLNTAVAKLRQAIGDRADNPRFIETIPRKGYRFIGSLIAPAEPVAASRDEPAVVESAVEPLPVAEKTKPRRMAIPVIVALVTIALVGLAFLISQRRSARQHFRYSLEPVTTVGDVDEAIVSPDGKLLAYTSGPSDRQSLRIRTLATGEDHELPGVRRGFMHGLVFSFDSKKIYVSFGEFTNEIPIGGGVPVEILRTRRYIYASPSPDGSKMAFVHRNEPNNFGLYVARPDGSDEVKLWEYRFPKVLYGPAWSPREDVIAFGGMPDGFFLWDTMTIAARAGASPAVVSPRHFYRICRLAWLDNGNALVFSGVQSPGTNEHCQIWSMPYPATGEITRLTNGLDSYPSVSASLDSRVLGALREQSASEILLLSSQGELIRHLTTRGPAEDGLDGLTFVGDDRLVFASKSSGTNELWSINTDGGSRRRLTDNGARNLDPSASEPGHTILWSRIDQSPGFWGMDADGGNIRLISRVGGSYWSDTGRAPESRNQWGVGTLSPDGTFIAYLFVASTGQRSLFRVGVDSSSKPFALSNLSMDASPPAISPDNRWIAFGVDDGSRTAVIPASGGEPLLKLSIPGSSLRWTPDGKGLIYIRRDAGPDNLWTAPVFGGEAHQLTRFSDATIFGFAVSVTDKYLAVVHGSKSTDAVLLRANPN